MFLRIISILILICISINPVFSTKIEIKGKGLYVNDRPFVIKGVCYEPTPVGYTYTYAWEHNEDIYKMDFPLIKAMGANCIRTYDHFTTEKVLDTAYENGLYVIMQIRMPWDNNSYAELDYADTTRQNEILYGTSSQDGLDDIVAFTKAHPALLMWCLGHEVNFNVTLDAGGNAEWNTDTTNRLRDWYSFLNKAAKLVHEWEAPFWHPVTSGEGVANTSLFGHHSAPAGTDTLGNSVFGSDDSSVPYVDLWGVQTYMGNSLDNAYFNKYITLSSKPVWIAETGADAYDAINEEENQAKQSEYIVTLWNNIKANLYAVDSSKPCIGVTYFAWCDGWHKSDQGAHDVHNTNGWANSYYYDYQGGLGNMEEEWWGLVSIFPGTVERGLRTAYYSLKNLWTSDADNESIDNILFRKNSVNIPNPFNLSKDSYTDLWFYTNYSSTFKIYIYDYAGRLIRELKDPSEFSGYVYQKRWDGKDEDGNLVRTGLYLCKVEAMFAVKEVTQIETQYIKIAVIR